MRKLLMLLFFCVPAFSGHMVGNGGDYIRASFISLGNSVVDVLENTDAGRNLLVQNGLDLETLKASLTIDKIKVTNDTLIDNSGSVVDAIGVKDSILLNAELWLEHFERNRDIYYLVFHEMLRAVSVNDDNYVISKALSPFPKGFAVDSRILADTELLKDEKLDGIVDFAKIMIAGQGCPSNQQGTRIEIDPVNNSLDLIFRNFRVKTEGSQYKACNFMIPIQIPKSQRLVISQVDISAKINLAANSSASIQSEVFLPGTSGKINRKEFRTASETLQGRTLIRKTDVMTSECGENSLLRVRTNAFVSGGTESHVNIRKTKIYFNLESCRQSP
jgi:hypothetical protein